MPEISATLTETWTVAQLVAAIEHKADALAFVRVPPFQRNLVWTAAQKKNFIDSVKRGFPIGAILLYRTGFEGKQQIFTIIDGLQRSNALLDCVRRPTQYFQPGEIPDELLDYCGGCLDLGDFRIDGLLQHLLAWLENKPSFEEEDGYSGHHLAADLITKFPSARPLDERLLAQTLRKLRERANVREFKLPILIYNGERANLPDIFNRLNSKGTQLSKYQIFAATWVNEPLTIADPAIVDVIRERYRGFEEAGYELEGIDSATLDTTSTYSLFDLLFGFGRALARKFPELFADAEDSASGFSLFTVCTGLPLRAMDQLPDALRKKGWEANVLANKISNAAAFVAQQLQPVLKLRALGGPTGLYHSEYQMVSLVAKVFLLNYGEDLKEKPSWLEQAKALREALLDHYLYDIIAEVWRGSGDSRLSHVLESEAYTMRIERTLWESAFNQMLASQMGRRTSERQPVDRATMLLLKFLYAKRVAVFDDASTDFEMEHLIPVGRLRKMVESESASSGEKAQTPMSCAGNIALLPRELNRKKGDLTIVEYVERQVEGGAMNSDEGKRYLEQYLSFALLRDRTEVRIPGCGPSPVPTSAWYEKFLTDRFQRLQAEFFSLYSVSSRAASATSWLAPTAEQGQVGSIT